MNNDLKVLFIMVHRTSVLSGESHPVEPFLEAYLIKYGIHELFEEALTVRHEQTHMTDFLHLLSRSKLLNDATKIKLIQEAFRSSIPWVWESAIQAAENWGDRHLASLLRSYNGLEMPAWIREYYENVIQDLESQ